ncbi:DUF2061 domain-containing protein [Marinomonas ostreistagni]|uniref:DUF2061 domain-containing protein n=1 Tax=Marinomonas ostreistagni TaxID=359209 RepID=UPI00194E0BCA|nr:DUF2061 domain-containing protein [Marinomonas ostreistagni]MBM6551317.1 DUF2061 domain-containing protein [Marinomonas ostreistagni]
MKTLTFALVHFSIAFTVTYLVTGSFLLGGTVALLEPAVNTVAYHFHEKLWANGRLQALFHQEKGRFTQLLSLYAQKS